MATLQIIGDMSFLCYLSATGLCPARVVLLLG